MPKIPTYFYYNIYFAYRFFITLRRQQASFIITLIFNKHTIKYYYHNILMFKKYLNWKPNPKEKFPKTRVNSIKY